MRNSKPYRIVLTGGPGGGKTTAADLFRREVGEKVVIVPETATLLFSGGLPRSSEPGVIRHTQRAIFHTQRAMEDIQAELFGHRVLLCDRGTLDGAAYWPVGEADYFESMGTTLHDELSRYDAVIFFETAAAGDILIEGGNRVRTESNAEARTLDKHLQTLWRQHPSFHFVPHSKSFFGKLQLGLQALERIVTAFDNGSVPTD